jgi:hypothetical protein
LPSAARSILGDTAWEDGAAWDVAICAIVAQRDVAAASLEIVTNSLACEPTDEAHAAEPVMLC